MRKLISILSVTCLLLGLGLVQAKATIYTNNVSFAAGATYDIVAEGDITGQAPRVTLSGSITISQGTTIIKQITINQTANSDWQAIDEFLIKLLQSFPH